MCLNTVNISEPLLTCLLFVFFISLFPSPKVGSHILESSAYHTRSRGHPPPPPPSNTKNRGKAKMDDLSGIRKENAKNVETSDGRSTPAPNDLVLRLEQKILELQELE